jgi:hypothetical protein
MATSATTVLLEWTFSPSDYFEEPITISRDDYSLVIASGTIRATIAGAAFDADPSMLTRLHESLIDRMHGIQLINHKPFELANPNLIRVHPDGRRDIVVELKGGELTLTGGVVDFRVTDKDGNLLHDSKRERLDRKRSFAELVSKYRPNDVLLRTLLASYDASTRDPNNELVHLYEIRESLAARFGGETETRTALGLPASDWSRFGQLCNNEPLRQGRHRGKSVGNLRDATEAELTEARGIARSMIDAYLDYREKGNVAP